MVQYSAAWALYSEIMATHDKRHGVCAYAICSMSVVAGVGSHDAARVKAAGRGEFADGGDVVV
jgi:hypothetical protein